MLIVQVITPVINYLYLSTIDKIHLKTNVIDGSVVNGLREPVLFSFVLDKPRGITYFVNPRQYTTKKINKSVLNTITFHLEYDDNEEVNFNGETLSFTLQLIKI